MLAATKYRSMFTGRQIDDILKSVRDKIDKSSITQDYEEGGTEMVVSAEAVKNLSDAFNNTFTPSGVKDLLEQAEDSNIFTDSDKRKVNGINTQFKGTVPDIATRDAIDTQFYTGGEVLLILRNNADVSEFQYWDILTETWNPVTSGGGERDRATIPAGAAVIASFDINDVSGVKYVVHGKSPLGDVQIVEVLVANKLTNVHWTAFGEIIAGDQVFNLDVELNGVDVELKVTASQASTVISISKLAEF